MCVLVGACSQWEIQLSDPRGVHVGDTFSGVLRQWGWSGWKGKFYSQCLEIYSSFSLTFKLPFTSLEQVSPLPKNRSPLSSNGCAGSNFARWSSTNCPNGGTGSRPCQTYENLEFLYKNPSASSASAPPPLPAKVIQRGEMILNKRKTVYKRAYLEFSVFVDLICISLCLWLVFFLSHRSFRPPDFGHSTGRHSQSKAILQPALPLQSTDTDQEQLFFTQHRKPRSGGETHKVPTWTGRSVQGSEAELGESRWC